MLKSATGDISNLLNRRNLKSLLIEPTETPSNIELSRTPKITKVGVNKKE